MCIRDRPPGLGHAQAQILQAYAQDAARSHLACTGAVVACHLLADLHRLFGKVVLGQQAAQVLEHGRQEGLFAFARQRRQFTGQRAGHQRTQELFLELRGVHLVAHVFQQQHRQGHVADAGETHQRHGARNGADAAAGHGREVRRVDHAQQLVGQRDIAQDLVGQAPDAFGVRGCLLYTSRCV